MPLVAVAVVAAAAVATATAAAAAGRKQEASSRSATSRRVNEPNAQINRRGRAKIIRDAVSASGDASRLRRRLIRCTRERACEPTIDDHGRCVCARALAVRIDRVERIDVEILLLTSRTRPSYFNPFNRSITTWRCLVV